LVPGIVPKLSKNPGQTLWLGPDLGEHTDEVLGSLGLSDDELKSLKQSGVI